MVRSSKKLVVIGAVVVAAFLAAAPQAEAFWGWGCCGSASYYTPYYASCGYSPCYASCYSSCYSSCYDYGCGSWYVGYRPGPVRRALLGPYRWYYSGGCCYDSCCATSCCGSCCDTCTTSCCGATTTTTTQSPTVEQPTVAPPQQPVTEPAPGVPATTAPAPEPGAVPPASTGLPTTSLPTRENSGLLTVWVPAGAKVFVNGKETTTQGTRRRYVSFGLQPGLNYKYDVRAEIVRNGRIAEEAKTVYLTAGGMEGVAFGFNREPINQVAAQQ